MAWTKATYVAEPVADTGTSAEIDGETDTGTRTGSETGAETDTGAGSETSWDWCLCQNWFWNGVLLVLSQN